MAGINDGYSGQLFSGLLAARGINSAQINGGIQAAINGQNSANKANQQRYDQGLSTLQQGSDKSAGLLQSATNQIQNNGQAQFNRIDLQEQQGKGNAAQSAVSRGLTDTTIQDAMQRGVSRDANDARLANQEQINRQQAAAKDAQANQAMQGAGSISNWIGSRTDNGPNMGLLAQMIETASSNPQTQRTAQINRQTVPGLGGAAGNNGLPSNFGQPASSNNGYSMGASGAVPYGSANFAGSMGGMGGMGGTGGGGGGSAPASGGGSTYYTNGSSVTPGNPGPVQSALSPSADQSVSSALATPAPAATQPTAQAANPGQTWFQSPTGGKFTKSEWDALTPEQQKNLAAGRAKDQGPSASPASASPAPFSFVPEGATWG